jgi:hypothetical protein
MTTLFTNIAHWLKRNGKNHHILMAFGDKSCSKHLSYSDSIWRQELQQAPNKNEQSPHLMLMSGLTIFFYFGFILFSVLCTNWAIINIAASHYFKFTHFILSQNVITLYPLWWNVASGRKKCVVVNWGKMLRNASQSSRGKFGLL